GLVARRDIDSVINRRIGAPDRLGWLTPKPPMAVEAAIGSSATHHRAPLLEPADPRSARFDRTASRAMLEPFHRGWRILRHTQVLANVHARYVASVPSA